MRDIANLVDITAVEGAEEAARLTNSGALFDVAIHNLDHSAPDPGSLMQAVSPVLSAIEDIPLIVLAASTETSFLTTAMKLGVSAYLTSDTPLATMRSEEHTSELQSLMRISYAVFCLKKKK